MKQRLLTATITGAIGAAVGIGVAIWQGQNNNMLGIAFATGTVGFLLGLVFKFRAV